MNRIVLLALLMITATAYAEIKCDIIDDTFEKCEDTETGTRYDVYSTAKRPTPAPSPPQPPMIISVDGSSYGGQHSQGTPTKGK